jgi:hypothetical protein
MNTSTLEQLFKLANMSRDMEFRATVGFMQMSENRIAKFTLSHTSRAHINEPDALTVSIVSKSTGVIDELQFPFSQYLKCESGNLKIAPAAYALTKAREQKEKGLFDRMYPIPASIKKMIEEASCYILSFENP